MWKKKLQEIADEKNLYGEKINDGATTEAIQRFLKEVKSELNVDLPNEYVRFLEIINGVEFNGFILYGIDQYLQNEEQNQLVNGLIDYNKIWYENEWQKQYVFLGESNISWYIYDLVERTYYQLDNPSGRKIQAFNNLEHLLVQLLSDALA